jgi:hypothetical protein
MEEVTRGSQLGREVKSRKEEEERNQSMASGPQWTCSCRKQLPEQAYVKKVTVFVAIGGKAENTSVCCLEFGLSKV